MQRKEILASDIRVISDLYITAVRRTCNSTLSCEKSRGKPCPVLPVSRLVRVTKSGNTIHRQTYHHTPKKKHRSRHGLHGKYHSPECPPTASVWLERELACSLFAERHMSRHGGRGLLSALSSSSPVTTVGRAMVGVSGFESKTEDEAAAQGRSDRGESRINAGTSVVSVLVPSVPWSSQSRQSQSPAPAPGR